MAHTNTTNSPEAVEGFVTSGEALRAALKDHPLGPIIDPRYRRGSHLMVGGAAKAWAVFEVSYWIDRHGDDDCQLDELARFDTETEAEAALTVLQARRAAA